MQSKEIFDTIGDLHVAGTKPQSQGTPSLPGDLPRWALVVALHPDRTMVGARCPIEPGSGIVLGRRVPEFDGKRSLNDSQISENHARVTIDQRGVVLLDQGSKNGTYVNGTHLPSRTSKSLGSGDVVTIGPVVLLLRYGPWASHNSNEGATDGLLGRSHAIATLRAEIGGAPPGEHILIRGETGAGKEVVAKLLHSQSKRRPFVPVNCATLNDQLAELFGYVKNAFTGAATHDQKGLVEEANHGTLFLDELAELKPQVQAQLLRFAQDRRFRPIGGAQEKVVDVRIVAASNANFEEKISAQTFREDLYHRLGHEIRVPPLRDRMEDLPLLFFHFAQKYLETQHKGVPLADLRVSRTLMVAFLRHTWPGNVRELQKATEQVVAAALASPSGSSFHVRMTSTLQARFSRSGAEVPDGLSVMPPASDSGDDLQIHALPPVASRPASKPIRLEELTNEDLKNLLRDAGSMKELAAQVDVNRGALYNTFRDRNIVPGEVLTAGLRKRRRRGT